MFFNRKCPIYCFIGIIFSFIFIKGLFFNYAYGYNLINESISFNENNDKVVGTIYEFEYKAESQSSIYEWTIFNDYNELFKSEFSKDNTLRYKMKKSGTYQILLRIKTSNGDILSKLSKPIKIINPMSINSVDVSINGESHINMPIKFSASALGENLHYRWSIMHNFYLEYTSEESIDNTLIYIPKKPGKYKATVYVTNDFGDLSVAYSKDIIVNSNKTQLSSDDKTTSNVNENLKKFIKESNLHSKTNHYILVDTKKNLTHILEKDNNSWSLLKSFTCTDGKSSTPTVKGKFVIQGRAPWLTSYNGKVKAKNKVRFYGNYYFHSILFDSNGKNIVDSRLGKSLSHGCVRLSVQDSKWIYDNILDGTGVYIY